MSGPEGQEAPPWPRSEETDGRLSQRQDNTGQRGRMEHNLRDTARLKPLSCRRCAVIQVQNITDICRLSRISEYDQQDGQLRGELGQNALYHHVSKSCSMQVSARGELPVPRPAHPSGSAEPSRLWGPPPGMGSHLRCACCPVIIYACFLRTIKVISV